MSRSKDTSSKTPSPRSPLRWAVLAVPALAVLGYRLCEKILAGARAARPAKADAPAKPVSKANGAPPPEPEGAKPVKRPAKPPAGAEPAPAAAPPAKSVDGLDLDEILRRLDVHRQRATYGAVAELVDKLPMNLMRGREKEPRHSWVVNEKTHKPTKYTKAQLHPELTANDHVIADTDELRIWLADHD